MGGRGPLEAARVWLQAITGIGAEIDCPLNNQITYGRVVGICFKDLGQDVGTELIRRSQVLDCNRYFGGGAIAVSNPRIPRTTDEQSREIVDLPANA